MPRLLCEEELPTWDYRQYSKHLTVQHRVVTEYDLLLKLSLLSKQISSGFRNLLVKFLLSVKKSTMSEVPGLLS